VLPGAFAGVAAWKRSDTAQAKAAARQMLIATLYFDRADLADQRPVGKRSVVGKLATLGSNRVAVVSDADAAARFTALRAELASRLNTEPGVIDVVFASNAPGDEAVTRIEADTARPDETTGASLQTGITRIDGGYLGAFGIPLLAGRGLETRDIGPRTSSVLVNRSFARKTFGDANPLGHRIRTVAEITRTGATQVPRPWEEIVGVVPDFPIDSGPPSPKVYRPLLAPSDEPVMIALRMNDASPARFANRLRELTVATNPMLRLESIKPLDQTLYDSGAGIRLTIVALELVTMSAVLLSAAGIYALMSFTITRRRREIGIRSALGAGPRRVLGGVLSRVFVHVAIGIAIGVAVAGLFDHVLEGGWTGRRAAFVLPAVAAFMLVTGLIAAIRPASWALRISPTEALRAD
jgi:putative ABC transport system permease protein